LVLKNSVGFGFSALHQGRRTGRHWCAQHGLKLFIWKEITGSSNDNRSETQGGNREVSLKEADSKCTTVGTRASSEAKLVVPYPKLQTIAVL
jgi:hypothetical protein